MNTGASKSPVNSSGVSSELLAQLPALMRLQDAPQQTFQNQTILLIFYFRVCRVTTVEERLKAELQTLGQAKDGFHL